MADQLHQVCCTAELTALGPVDLLQRSNALAQTANSRTSLAHAGFLVAIAIKGLDGALETLAGLLVWISGPWRFYTYVIWTVAPELASHVGGHAARIVQHDAGQLAQSSTFVIIYLLAHGPLKLAIAIELLRGRLWIFPLASAVLLGFIVYMTVRAAEHPSAWLLAFALLDAITLALVLNEWRTRRGMKGAN